MGGRMLLNRTTLEGIRAGSISLAFRRWRRPTVRPGGTLLTAIGQLAIEAVDPVDLEDITVAEARAAGFEDLAALRTRLEERQAGDVYRIRLALAGADPRIALREETPDEAELASILQRLGRMDARSGVGPWTESILEKIRDRPGERAGDLAADLGVHRPTFKANVRKLKALGLTESLKVGYRLSPRGHAVLDRLGGGENPRGGP